MERIHRFQIKWNASHFQRISHLALKCVIGYKWETCMQELEKWVLLDRTFSHFPRGQDWTWGLKPYICKPLICVHHNCLFVYLSKYPNIWIFQTASKSLPNPEFCYFFSSCGNKAILSRHAVVLPIWFYLDFSSKCLNITI